jgi:hypothetical protein
LIKIPIQILKMLFRNAILSLKISFSSKNIISLPFDRNQKNDSPYKALKKFFRPNIPIIVTNKINRCKKKRFHFWKASGSPIILKIQKKPEKNSLNAKSYVGFYI